MAHRSVGMLISSIYKNTHLLHAHHLKKHQLGSGQFAFFWLIHKNPGINQENLSQRLKVNKATTAKVVKKLMEMKLVKREKYNLDLRNYKLSLTKKGEALVPELKPIMQHTTKTLTKDFSYKETEIIIHLLNKMLNNIEEEVLNTVKTVHAEQE